MVNDRRQPFSRIPAVLLFVLAASAAACVQNDPTATLAAIPQTITDDTFSGTIPAGGTDTRNFTVAQGGGVIDMTLATTSPANTSAVMTLGFTANGACNPLIGPFTVLVGQTATTQLAMPPGGYCLILAAGSNTSVPVTYTVIVSHP